MRFITQARFLFALSCAFVMSASNATLASAQKFLEPVVSQPPPLEIVAISEPTHRIALPQRAASLPTVANGLTALTSVDMTPIPSGQYSYGFAQSADPSLTFDVGSVPVNVSFNSAALGSGPGGSYGGRALPQTASSSVDMNTVDCPFLRDGRSTPGIGLDPIGEGGSVQIEIGNGWQVGVSSWQMQSNPDDVSLSALNAFFGN